MSNKYIGFQRISSLKTADFLVSVNNKFYTFIEQRDSAASPALLHPRLFKTRTHKNMQFLCHSIDSSSGTFIGGDRSFGCYQGWRHCSSLSVYGTLSSAFPSARQKGFVNRKWSSELQKHEACGGRRRGLRTSAEKVENEPTCEELGGILKSSQDIKSQVS